MIVPDSDFSTGEVAQHYDELDVFYREIWGEHVHHGLWVTGRESRNAAVRQLVDVVAAEAEIEPGDEVLDIGSGYGAAARQITLDYGARVTGLTLSPAQYDYARRRNRAHGLRFVHGDWLSNDLPDTCFDAVYAIESASHMPDAMRFVNEAVLVLRPGGTLVVCAWMAAEEAPPLHARWLLEPICREGRLAHLSTVREYVSMVEAAGAVLTEFRDLTPNVRRTWPVAIGRTIRTAVARPRLLEYLFSSENRQRAFLLTMVRMWLAYRVGALRYGLLKAYRMRPHRNSANLA